MEKGRFSSLCNFSFERPLVAEDYMDNEHVLPYAVIKLDACAP